jgi:hypothetical protein
MESVVDLLKGILSIPVPFNMAVLVVLIFCVTGVFTSFLKQVRKYACHKREVDLKRDLVERGLSVEEIERIIAAKGSTSNDSST